jgi:hypothetical protein
MTLPLRSTRKHSENAFPRPLCTSLGWTVEAHLRQGYGLRETALTHDDALIGGFIVAFLRAALMWFLWIAPDLAMYFATGLIRLPPVF